MSDDRTRIVFNRYAQPAARATGAQGGPPAASFFFADAPVVQLNEIARAPRNGAQQIPSGGAAHASDTVFGDLLGWAYRGYIVHALGAAAAGPSDALGTEPDQPAILAERREQLAETRVLPHNAPGGRPVCLFNVVVALEWTPSPRYVQQLKWAFQRASELLYDITDGTMAFGQVVFGGRELMGCADFQFMASNRLHPRSFVNGLHDPKKYTAIRCGRGLWQKDLNLTTSWEEPEAYRILVHEWGHYALSLKDEYLGLAYVAPDRADATRLAAVRKPATSAAAPDGVEPRLPTEGDELALVLPGISLPIESIMSKISSSELVAQKEASSSRRKVNEWAKIAEKPEFEFLKIDPEHEPVPGPMRLPLPLPQFCFWGDLEQAIAGTSDMRLRVPSERVRPDHCWVYVVKGDLTNPRQLIAQGTVDARSEADGFLLLGAAPEDTVLLIGLAPDSAASGESRTVVLRARAGDVRFEPRQTERDAAAWTEVTPDPFPFVDVVPVLDEEGGAPEGFRPKRVRVAVSPSAGETPYHGARRWVFPLGGEGGIEAGAEPIAVASLDGHVLVSIDGGRQVTVSTYSQGGGPGATPPVHANPTTAGSSEGNVMLFFYDEQYGPAFGPDALPYSQLAQVGRDYSSLSIVTTLNHGIAAPEGARPRSYTFSFAGTEPLPQLDPTLVMFYDRETAEEAGEPRIYRHQGPMGGWVAVPTYLPPRFPYVAAPLVGGVAPGLSRAGGVERYRLCLRD